MISEDDIPDHWDLKKARELGDVITGGTPSTDVDEYWGGDIPWLRISDIKSGMHVYESEDKITDEGLDAGACSLLEEGSVIISTRATIGEVAIAGNALATNQGFKSIQPNDDVLPEFLAYYIVASSEYIKSLGKGATFDEVNKSQIEGLEIPVPPLEEQARIVRAIEERLSVIETLENSVNRVDDVSGEYEESILAFLLAGQENQSSGTISGLPSQEDVRAEWDVMELGEVVEYHSNLMDPSDEPDKDFDLVELADVERDAGGLSNVQQKKGTDIGSTKRAFSGEHVLYCKLRPYLNKVVKPEFEGIATSEFLVLEPDDSISREYLYQYLSSPMVRDKAEFLMKGANQPRISKKDLLSFDIPVPPLETQAEVVETMENVQKSELGVSISNLNPLFEEYRDSVLYHAFYGEIVG